MERYGAVRYRLTIFPPGADAATRWWLRAWHFWCGAGAVSAVGVALLMTIVLPPAVAIGMAVVCYVAGWAGIRRRLGLARSRTRRVTGVDLAGYSTAHERDRCGRMLQQASILTAADGALRSGGITPADHEVIWGGAYDEIGRVIAEDRVVRD